MTRDEMLKTLKDTFKDYQFFEEQHYYEYKGERVGISVTRFIEKYANKFDSYGVAEKVANRDGKTIQQVLDEWQLTNDLACEKGHLGHCYAQSKWNGETYEEHIKDGLETIKTPLELIKKQADNFYNDFNDKLEHLIDELPIGSPESDIASCVDDLFINKYTGGLVLVDYKTNSDIYKDQKYYKNSRKKPPKMKVPLNHLDDYKIIHYYIQLSIYRYIIEKYTGLKIDEMFIVYMSENIENYEIISIPYLKDEVEKILEWRKWE